MYNVAKIVRDFYQDEDGLTLLEYILGAAFIVAAIFSLGFWSGIKSAFGLVANKIDSESG